MTWQIVYIHLPLCDYIIHLSLECRPFCLFWSVSGIMLSVLERSIHMSPIANNQMTALNLNRNSPHDSRDVISKYYDMSQCSSHHQLHQHDTILLDGIAWVRIRFGRVYAFSPSTREGKSLLSFYCCGCLHFLMVLCEVLFWSFLVLFSFLFWFVVFLCSLSVLFSWLTKCLCSW